MQVTLPHRIVKLEENVWRIHSSQDDVDAEEEQELRDYFDEIRVPYRILRGRLCVLGTIPWETVRETLAHFYEGRAEVCRA